MIIKSFLDKSIWPSLLLFPLANMGLFFFFSGKVNTLANGDIAILMKQIFILIVVAIAEELFLRGLLLRELVFGFQVKPLVAATIVSLIFGVLHIVNVFSYASFSYAVVQGLCAFAVGVDLAAIYCRFRSVIPCIIIHSSINITSIGLDSGADKLILTSVEASVFLVVAVLYLVHGYQTFKDRCF